MLDELTSRKCEIEAPNGDRYESELFGIYQYRDHEFSYPVAVVKLRDGSLGSVNLKAVKLIPVKHYFKKDGTRVDLKDGILSHT